jgi:hypothetical protein
VGPIGAERPLGRASRPHMSVGHAPPWWRVSWSLLEPSHIVSMAEFYKMNTSTLVVF